jgi:hypothetical protein
MKKTISFVACLILTALLASCGGSKTSSGGDTVDLVPQDATIRLTDMISGDQMSNEDGAQDLAEDGASDLADEEINGFDYPCDPLSVEACVTVCGSAGQRKCLKEWGPCLPPVEWCGNCQDDNCDGQANEGCPLKPECDDPIDPECPVAQISVTPGLYAWTGDEIQLSAKDSHSEEGQILKWHWTVQAPAGSQSTFQPDEVSETVTFYMDAAGQYLFSLEVWDAAGIKSCVPAQKTVNVQTYPPVDPEVGCSDGTREGFLDLDQYPHIAACSGAWDQPGITPEGIEQTCAGQAGNDGAKKEGKGCSTPDLCAAGWHACITYKEVAEKSPTGCAGATPPDAKNKSLFFAVRQPSYLGSVCGDWGDGFNDVFGCGNLGAGLGDDKDCGPLDRVLASTSPNSCGFNEAEPPHGPWECMGPDDSHLNEGALVTKKECTGGSCQYDGDPIGSSDKGGILCCRD